jgi:hypothetical protein
MPAEKSFWMLPGLRNDKSHDIKKKKTAVENTVILYQNSLDYGISGYSNKQRMTAGLLQDSP